MWVMQLAEIHHRVDVYAMLHELHSDELVMWRAYYQSQADRQTDMMDPDDFLAHAQTTFQSIPP